MKVTPTAILDVILIEPAVFRDGSNLLLHLRPAPVVARVATTTAMVRDGVEAWFQREVAVASHLVERGAPVVPPSNEVPPGPHQRNGLWLTFWRYVDQDRDRVPTHEEVTERRREQPGCKILHLAPRKSIVHCRRSH